MSKWQTSFKSLGETAILLLQNEMIVTVKPSNIDLIA